MVQDRRNRLTRLLSYALRHSPQSFSLQLNPGGWADVETLLLAVQQRRSWQDVSAEELHALVWDQETDRFEITGGLIRARYGHSVGGVPPGECCEPPSLLFHATRACSLRAVQKDGLAAHTRRYAHLTSSFEYVWGIKIQHDKGDSPGVILGVNTERVRKAAIPFYQASSVVWTTPYVPPDCLSLIIVNEQPADTPFREIPLTASVPELVLGPEMQALLELFHDNDEHG